MERSSRTRIRRTIEPPALGRSAASRIHDERRLSERVVSMMARPGKKASHQAVAR